MTVPAWSVWWLGARWAVLPHHLDGFPSPDFFSTIRSVPTPDDSDTNTATAATNESPEKAYVFIGPPAITASGTNYTTMPATVPMTAGSPAIKPLPGRYSRKITTQFFGTPA